MSIESKYNELRTAAREARALAAHELGSVSEAGRRVYLERVCERATVLAAVDWQRVRSVIAAEGGHMPLGPHRFGCSGYVYGEPLHDAPAATALAVYSSRARSDTLEMERRYVEQAEKSLEGELDREALLAESAFERYRRAVEQGVAVDPEGTGDA